MFISNEEHPVISPAVDYFVYKTQQHIHLTLFFISAAVIIIIVVVVVVVVTATPATHPSKITISLVRSS